MLSDAFLTYHVVKNIAFHASFLNTLVEYSWYIIWRTINKTKAVFSLKIGERVSRAHTQGPRMYYLYFNGIVCIHEPTKTNFCISLHH